MEGYKYDLICHTDFTNEQIKSVTKEAILMYNKAFNTEIKFEDIFEDPFICDKKYWKKELNNWKGYYYYEEDKVIGFSVLANKRGKGMEIIERIKDFLRESFNGFATITRIE